MGTLSNTYFEKAKTLIPGGVNSPVRAFKSVGGNPVFIQSAKGAYLKDVDGNEYIDLIGSWGPMLFGQAHPVIENAVREALSDGFSFGAPSLKEVLIAEKIVSMIPSFEKVRLVNSGTEATMAAIRLARAYTKRDKIIKFEGCYHGHGDSFLIAAGSGVATLGTPDSPGVTESTARDTLTAVFNDLNSLSNLFDANPGAVAAVIVEPVVGNMGLVIPADGYLAGLRSLCDQHGALLIFDEVMTGFRQSASGYQGVCGVQPDLTTLGKIIGGGLPVGAYGGKGKIMDMIAPAGPVYQAGTLSGNPLATTAGLAMLNLITNDLAVYERLASKGESIKNGIRQQLNSLGKKYTINQLGSMFTLFFTDVAVNNFNDAKTADLNLFGQYFQGMLRRGVYLPPSQFESWFISDAIGDDEIAKILAASEATLTEMFS
ncbi:glutamate-1-semialdehyde 2,1-aminomutase [Aquirufa regiilacus]|uniref:Glutamate-1-semialdehyde 2,1-aminomutase n=1 Tax=Aquirufa regiilacus TaxID=3024868 RepID=A0ABU3TR02_9BACT|nr:MULTISPECIES: glutamate-1-semialdehyde 2,1-aminomutase [unclassified Aquirufa]MDT8886790.1 glutamate-1-semialdehyde 2,1-aminomutase [Aquirufa sp. LEPPI-3A]MDU0808245.1 glutamate-1-semialdehyde 2,1-aminomutase [Aquirufa sp. LEOWEIH-7C]